MYFTMRMVDYPARMCIKAPPTQAVFQPYFAQYRGDAHAPGSGHPHE